MKGPTERIVCWFSCGAASAVAAKLAVAKYQGEISIIIAYTEVLEEHEDNHRFLKDCETWIGQEIKVLRNEEFNASIYEVFRRTRFLKGPSGAACTRLLKKKVRKDFELPGDRQVFGFTHEERDRAERFMDHNPFVTLETPLIDKELRKEDCLAMIERAGIEIPAMYKMGYRNNNCIGCVKGEAGYWNKIRRDFPETFERMAQTEELLGRTVCKIERKGNLTRLTLRELPEDAGNYPKEVDIDCGIFCAIAEAEYRGGK